MNNLISEASFWLKDSGCKTGSIQDRTQFVLNRFREFIKNNKTEVEGQTGESLKVLLDQVDSCKKVFGVIIGAYLRGVQYIAIKTAGTFLKDIYPQALPGMSAASASLS